MKRLKYKILYVLRLFLGEKRYFNFLKILGERYVRLRILFSYAYRKDGIVGNKQIIYMADGKAQHGGLSDRLRAMVTLYSFCKEKGIEYKIYFASPFDLSQILQPNNVNWIINKSDISYNSREAVPIVILSTLGKIDNSERYILECKKEKEHTCRLINRYQKEQKHIYTNIGYDDAHFHKLFMELFKPSIKLQNEINNNLQAIGDKYISVVFRFQNLIGDFYEGPYRALNAENKKMLIRKCLDAIKIIRKQEEWTLKVLVTSDSKTFLNEVKNIPYCYIIPGQVKHMGFTNDTNSDVYLKSFVDLYMLSYSEKIILAKASCMYHSGFAQRAALLGDKPYKEYLID